MCQALAQLTPAVAGAAPRSCSFFVSGMCLAFERCMQNERSPRVPAACSTLPTRAVVSQQPRRRRDGHLAIALAFVGTLWVLACAPAEELDACDACLQSGGTWQVDTCTNDCDLQDTSCFRNACPAPCAADSCGTCFSTSECEAAGCAWHGEAEAQWCTASS